MRREQVTTALSTLEGQLGRPSTIILDLLSRVDSDANADDVVDFLDNVVGVSSIYAVLDKNIPNHLRVKTILDSTEDANGLTTDYGNKHYHWWYTIKYPTRVRVRAGQKFNIDKRWTVGLENRRLPAILLTPAALSYVAQYVRRVIEGWGEDQIGSMSNVSDEFADALIDRLTSSGDLDMQASTSVSKDHSDEPDVELAESESPSPTWRVQLKNTPKVVSMAIDAVAKTVSYVFEMDVGIELSSVNKGY